MPPGRDIVAGDADGCKLVMDQDQDLEMRDSRFEIRDGSADGSRLVKDGDRVGNT